MLLKDLFNNIKVLELIGSDEIEISLITQDSRDEVLKDGLYFAVPGQVVDGHNFIDEAIGKGAKVIVCERIPDNILEHITYVQVQNIKRIVGQVADTFYEHPSRGLTVIAVTGTNGKTTVASYTAQTLRNLQEKPLLLSTAGDYFDGQLIEINRKAPSSLETIELHKILREYLDQGATHVCLEATSQALHQDRLSGVDIDVAVFTNLEQDHLDYHKTVDHYASSKKLLFDNLKNSAVAVVNLDDVQGEHMVSDTDAKVVSYGTKSSYDYSFEILKTVLGSVDVKINEQPLTLPVIGTFNVYNVVSVYASLIELGYKSGDVVATLSNLTGVPGRMEQVENDRNILALVDYAHSPGALENVLETLRELPHNNITTVIGCGGDRDRTKRGPMAAVTQKLSDYVMYTSDNPRTEDINQIFSDMKEGVDLDQDNYQFITDREEAIQTAVNRLNTDDIILVAGKGHEDYQVIGTEKRHFDDREVLGYYLNQQEL